MLKIDAVVGLALFLLWLVCVIEVISTPESAMRNLPKTVWLLVVLFFPFVGSIAWLVAGREDRRPRRLSAYERAVPAFPEYDRPGRVAASDPERDAAFLASVRARADEQRRRYEQQRRSDSEG